MSKWLVVQTYQILLERRLFVLNKDPFEHIRRWQELANKMSQPYMQFQRLGAAPALESFMKINSSFGKAIWSINDSISPAVEAFQKNQNFIAQAIANQQKFAHIISPKFAEIGAAFQKMAEIHSTMLQKEIPDQIYHDLEKLISTLEDSLPKKPTNDLHATIEVHQSDQTKGSKITWNQLISYTIAICQILLMLYSINSDFTYQSDTLDEMKKQTNLQERQLANNQRLKREELQISNEILERQKALEEQFQSFLETVEPLISDCLDDPEDPDKTQASSD